MISDQNPSPLDDSRSDEQNKFKWPPLLAITRTNNVKEIRPYCYNSKDFKENEKYVLELKHTFL